MRIEAYDVAAAQLKDKSIERKHSIYSLQSIQLKYQHMFVSADGTIKESRVDRLMILFRASLA